MFSTAFSKFSSYKFLYINVYQTYDGKIENKETITLDLEKDLVKKSETEDTQKMSRNFRDIEFKYAEKTEIYETTYGEGIEDEEVYHLDINLKDNLIAINCYKNLYDESWTRNFINVSIYYKYIFSLAFFCICF